MAKYNRKYCVFSRSIENIELVESQGKRYLDLLQALAKDDNLPNLKSVLVWRKDQKRRDREDIRISREPQAWCRGRGIFI